MDPVAEWDAAYERVRGLVEGIDEQQAEVTVPACPDWTVRELLAHMVGLDADVVGGDEPDDHNAEWTQRQVDTRADTPVAGLLREWESVAEPLRVWMRANTSRPLGDIVIHEQDLRGALGVPGGRDTEGQRALRDRMVKAFGGRTNGLPPIGLVSETWQWCSAGAVEDAAVLLRASEFDLTRALMTRRSAEQLKAWTVRGDVEAYLPAFAGLGPLPEKTLNE